MDKIIQDLEQISRSAKSNSVSEAKSAIKNIRELLKNMNVGMNHESPLQKLDQELATWQAKLEVIFREPVGRNGMAKHAQYWITVIARSPRRLLRKAKLRGRRSNLIPVLKKYNSVGDCFTTSPLLAFARKQRGPRSQ